MWMQVSVVAMGGAFGASLRFLVTRWVSQSLVWGHFPLATFIVNVAGCFAFGLLFMVISQRFAMDATLRLSILVGFLGAFTTFSTFSFETVRLLQGGHFVMAFSYVFGSALACVTATWLGVQLFR
ncbi:MAG: fluoride efflux transporter CrcB [Gammaproteobacteria bacterium]|nr:MAG: fluoride efflux transporter CrcB [Gammaproteobacteria bacterium]